MSIQLLKEHTLNPEITVFINFMLKKSCLVPKICNINLLIENDPPPFGTFLKIHPTWYRHPFLIHIAVYCLQTEVTCIFALQGVHFAQITTDKLFVRPGKTSFGRVCL